MICNISLCITSGAICLAWYYTSLSMIMKEDYICYYLKGSSRGDKYLTYMKISSITPYPTFMKEMAYHLNRSFMKLMVIND